MNINWEISPKEIESIKSFIQDNSGHFVEKRLNRNVKRKNVIIDKDSILRNMAICLLTSQQRSGPESPVSRFFRSDPFPFTFSRLKAKEDIKSYVLEILIKHGLTRFINRIAKHFSANFDKLESQGWGWLGVLKDAAIHPANKEKEREIARKIKNDFHGLGPKQSRNFLQLLGLTQYEIPIDSRITKWLNKRSFPIPLSSKALSDENYYEFVSDGINFLCAQAGILPCILDAAIFSSYDNGNWNEENTIF